MNRHRLLAASSVLLALSLAACGERSDDRTVGQKLDAAVAKTGDAAREARKEARDAAATARDTTARTGDSARNAANDSRTSAMGAAGAIGAKVDDAQITAKVNAGLVADKDLSAIRIDVDTHDGVVTLSGPVPSASAKARADEIAKNVKDVKSVNNQLTVSSS